MASADRSAGRRFAIGGAIVAIAAVVAWWLSRGSSPDGQRAKVASGAPAPATASVSAPATPSMSEPDVHPDRGPEAVPIIPLDPPPPPPYPPGSQPLTEGTDPSMSAPEDDPVDSDHPLAIRAVISARRDVVHPPDPLVIDLEVRDDKGARLPVTGAYARFRSERSTPDGPWFRAEFSDDGSGADRAGGDRRYTLTFAPSVAARDALVGFHVFVEVGFDAPGGLGHRLYGMSMMYTDVPHGHLDGSFTEAIVDGSLVVGAGVTIDQAGQFKVIASLYASDGQTAIVFAQNSVRLDAGERSIPLTFFGKILRDKGLDGPYVLRYMMLFEEHADRGFYLPGVTVDPAYTTHAYKVAQFSPDPYHAPASTGPQITAQSPSQANKPPPMFNDNDRARGSIGAGTDSTPAPPR